MKIYPYLFITAVFLLLLGVVNYALPVKSFAQADVSDPVSVDFSEEEEDEVVNKVFAWLKKFDAGDWEATWNGSLFLQRSRTKSEWAEEVRAIRAYAGEVVKRIFAKCEKFQQKTRRGRLRTFYIVENMVKFSRASENHEVIYAWKDNQGGLHVDYYNAVD